MANNPVKPAKITPKKQYQTSEDDRIPWREEEKMATKFYDDVRTPMRSRDTSGNRCYGDADLDMLAGAEKYEE